MLRDSYSGAFYRRAAENLRAAAVAGAKLIASRFYGIVARASIGHVGQPMGRVLAARTARTETRFDGADHVRAIAVRPGKGRGDVARGEHLRGFTTSFRFRPASFEKCPSESRTFPSI